MSGILNFDTGIHRVVWDHPAQDGALPALQQLAPSGLKTILQLDRMLLPDDINTSVVDDLEPEVEAAGILSPDRFEAGLEAAGRALDLMLGDVSGLAPGDQQALEGLDKALREHQELRSQFLFYRDMLIAG